MNWTDRREKAKTARTRLTDERRQRHQELDWLTAIQLKGHQTMTLQSREQATTTQQQHRRIGGKETGCNQEAELNMICSGLFHTTLPAMVRPVWHCVRRVAVSVSVCQCCVCACGVCDASLSRSSVVSIGFSVPTLTCHNTRALQPWISQIYRYVGHLP